MGLRIRQAVLCSLLGICAPPALAIDPMLMFLLSAAREVVLATARAQKAPVTPLPVESTAYAGTSVEPDHLRRLIDECFTYLSDAQRREIFDSLHAALMDPKNAAVRGSMIDYFATRAVAVRDAQQRLANLSGPNRDRLVAEFKAAITVMPADEAAQLATLLREGALPVPRELNAQLLAALDAR